MQQKAKRTNFEGENDNAKNKKKKRDKRNKQRDKARCGKDRNRAIISNERRDKEKRERD